MIPEHVITEIRDRTDLVELVGGYVDLKRSGKNFQGLCPFHREKTASFNVSPERGIYHCFGCGVTGDGIRFLMEHDHLSFPEALRNLAERVGVDLTPYEGRGDARHGEEFDLLYRAHSIAARLYRETLRTPEGEAARAEIRRRGLSADIVEEYRLGASPDAWDRLMNAARKDGVSAEMLEKGGLAIRREKGDGHYDRFRGRLMFPIEAVGQKVIGFGGRVLDDGEPKYLNSPESPLFRKRKTLYGVPQAQAALRETRTALLVEGYTDVLALANVGIRGALAALGTAFTEDHASWLSRSCDRVIVLFDGDDAGVKAAYTSAGPLLGAGLDVRMVILPPGEDPDSFVRREGADALRMRLEKASGVVETLLGDEAWEGTAGRERAVRRVLEAVAPLKDPLRRRVHLDDLGSRLGLPVDLLEAQIQDLRREARKSEERFAAREKRIASRPPEGPPPDFGDVPFDDEESSVPPPAVVTGPPHEAERLFVALLLQGDALGEGLLEKTGASDFGHPLTRRIVERASALLSDGTPLTATALMASLQDDAAAHSYLGELAVEGSYAVDVERQAEDCMVALEKRRLEREQERIMTDLRRAKAQGDGEGLRELGRQRLELARNLARLKASRSRIP